MSTRLSNAESRGRRTQMVACFNAGQNAKEIAARFGVSLPTVYKAFINAGVGRRTRGRIPMPPGAFGTLVNWRDVDWTKRDTDIAAERGCTRERVRQVRVILGKPRAIGHHKTLTVMAAETWMRSAGRSLDYMTSREVAAVCPLKICQSTAWNLMKSLGIPDKRQFLKDMTPEKFRGLCKETEGGCWEWPRRAANNYARVGSKYGHRFAYELFIGEIPANHNVMHTCDNPPCCNPAHLFIGTDADNMADRTFKGRTHSKLTKENVIDIRKRLESGETRASIAARYGVTLFAIGAIARRETWRWIDHPQSNLMSA